MIGVTSNVRAFRRELDKQQSQRRLILAKSLTFAAKDAQSDMQDRMRRVLDQPSRFTLNSLRTKPATRQRLYADVFFKDFAPKGTPAAVYLRPLEVGGARNAKGFERALQRVGILAPNEYTVPADGGSIDLRIQAGRGVGGQYTKILSYLRANPDPLSNRGTNATRRGRGATYWRGGDFIWERLSRNRARPVLIIVNGAPRYQPILRMRETIRTSVTRRFPGIYRRVERKELARGR